MQDGLYEYLDVFVGVGFSKELASTDLFSKDYDDGGVFIYTKEQKTAIRRTKFNGKKGEMKFMQMIAYLFELSYDLALSRKHNVSDSPGFEGCGLIFEKKKKRQGRGEC